MKTVSIFLFLFVCRYGVPEDVTLFYHTDYLEPVVVTGTKTNKVLKKSPIKTILLDAEALKKRHVKNLKDALESVPGLTIEQIHGKNGSSVSIQGFDSDRILILIDGERVTASTGSTVDLNQILASEIVRIEVVKGATSSLYGSEAMGGVINVITDSDQEGLRFSLGVESGSYLSASKNDLLDTLRIFQTANYQNKKWSIKFNSEYLNDNGFDFDESNISTNGDELSQINVDTRVRYHFNENINAYLGIKYYDEFRKRLTGILTPGVGELVNQYTDDVMRTKGVGGLEFSFGENSLLKVGLYVEDFSDESIQDILSSTIIEQARSADVLSSGGELQFDTSLGEKHFLTMGLVSLLEKMEQTQIKIGSSSTNISSEIPADSDKTNHAIYLQDDYQILEDLEIILGIRYQYDSDFSSFLAPKANLSYSFNDDLMVRIGFGMGYRVPNLKERYYFFDHSNLGYQVIGNPQLTAEKSINYQLGFQYSLNQYLDFELEGFYHDVKNLIETEIDVEESVATGLQIFTYQNIQKVENYGFDSLVQFKSKSIFKSYLGYSLLIAKDKNANGYLPKRSKHQVKAGITFYVEKTKSEVLIDWVYQGSQWIDSTNTLKSPAWHTVDVRWNQKFFKKLTGYGGFKNVLNEHRDPNPKNGVDYRPVQGRTVYLGIRYDF